MLGTPVSIQEGDCVQAPLDTGRLTIRPFDPERDSKAQISKLLRRAAASLDMARDLPGYCQGAVRAMHRSMADESCVVAVCKGRIAGTLSLQGADPASACRHFRRPDVATLHWYGVEPSWQRRGVGRALLSFGNRWAAPMAIPNWLWKRQRTRSVCSTSTVARASNWSIWFAFRAVTTTAPSSAGQVWTAGHALQRRVSAIARDKQEWEGGFTVTE